VKNTVSENNRRSGMSVVAASDVSVEFSTFRGSQGQSPEAGLNCEPNSGGEVRNVRIVGSTFESNRGIGLYVHKALGRTVAGAAVVSSLVRNNDQGIVLDGVSGASVVASRVLGHSGASKSGIVLGATTGTVAANRVEGNTRGILSLGASRITIQANQVVGLGPTTASTTDADGIVCRGLNTHAIEACVVSGNVVSRFAGTGILTQLVARVRVLDNVVDAVGQRGLWVRETTYTELLRNRPSRIGLREPGRYNAIEVTHASHYNVVASSHCSLGASARGAVAVATGCVGNRVYSNTVAQALPTLRWLATLFTPPEAAPS
jgi:nitrous oxidase accessory protein NosD